MFTEKTLVGGIMRGFTIFIIIILALVAVYFIGMTRLPDFVANKISSKLGVAVSIDKIKPRLSEIEIEKLVIGNPKGYSLPRAFSAEEIEIEAPITTFMKDEVVINQIEVEDIYLGLEFDSTSGADGNWSVILNHLENAIRKDVKPEESVLIKRIIFTNIRTELLFRSGGGKPKMLPVIDRIELTNISSKGGFPTDQLMNSILGQMIREVFIKQNLNNLLDDLIKVPGSALDKLFNPFGSVVQEREAHSA